ncbi:VWA domain-containing protein [Tsukamurella sp. 8F]|uniref:VWA domain-containing protein n=1 Tax=unclassified Tsukamurella TaxID=2633480 RepID=UPI0023B956B3|nr:MULTISPECIES: VWA domain-containing protein [unclassified Tsukamurella]MDF0529788.1 VWA domain-containing protein [Tsukamurella sp. 8J]MDF0586980.1 VWA domain-containing protein [Tsukamurella sp. 8F]
MGRHQAAHATPVAQRGGRRAWWTVLALALAVLLVVGLWRVFATAGGGHCSSSSKVTVAVDDALKPVAEQRAAAASDSCTTYSVESAADASMPARLAGGGTTPDLWLAPSDARVAEVSSQVGRDLPATTVATSPIVLAGAQKPAPKNWLDALGSPDLRSLPKDSPFADAPLVAAVAEAGSKSGDEQALTGALTRYAQAVQPVSGSGDPVKAAKDSGATVVVPEYAYLQAKKADSAVAAAVPGSGTALDRVQLVVTATGDRRTDVTPAGEKLAGAFTSSDGARALKSAGLRPDGSDAGKGGPDGGVGDVELLPEPDAAKLKAGAKALAAVAIPLKTIVVVDISGSMGFASGDTTRIGMTVSGFDRVVSMISDTNSIGLWAFSLSSSGQNWVSLAPTEPLGQKDGSASHRQTLIDAANTLPKRVKGGTGLYSTALAAYKQAQGQFDPAYSNSVILLTDGTDEDPGGMSLDSLVSQLKSIADPARPIMINTVGISQDADMNAITRIAEATGGNALRANSQQDLLADFVTAVGKRTTK